MLQYNAVNATVIGKSGGPPSEFRRTNLFTSIEEVILEDDEGKGARTDFGKDIYKGLLSVFPSYSQTLSPVSMLPNILSK